MQSHLYRRFCFIVIFHLILLNTSCEHSDIKEEDIEESIIYKGKNTIDNACFICIKDINNRLYALSMEEEQDLECINKELLIPSNDELKNIYPEKNFNWNNPNFGSNICVKTDKAKYEWESINNLCFLCLDKQDEWIAVIKSDLDNYDNCTRWTSNFEKNNFFDIDLKRNNCTFMRDSLIWIETDKQNSEKHISKNVISASELMDIAKRKKDSDDSDLDGVLNKDDNCPDTPEELREEVFKKKDNLCTGCHKSELIEKNYEKSDIDFHALCEGEDIESWFNLIDLQGKGSWGYIIEAYADIFSLIIPNPEQKTSTVGEWIKNHKEHPEKKEIIAAINANFFECDIRGNSYTGRQCPQESTEIPEGYHPKAKDQFPLGIQCGEGKCYTYDNSQGQAYYMSHIVVYNTGEIDIIYSDEKYDPSKFLFAASGTPTLIRNGELNIDGPGGYVYYERILNYGLIPFVGVNEDKSKIYLGMIAGGTQNTAKLIMETTDVYEAVSFDSGGSPNLWFKGESLKKTTRIIPTKIGLISKISDEHVEIIDKLTST
ncbi:hypothetical protein GF327_10405 [Candidatus Woesearchaeota archaeon]|nr:hypothetical protein [Candidatus Woesearchaeota archaeon]